MCVQRSCQKSCSKAMVQDDTRGQRLSHICVKLVCVLNMCLHRWALGHKLIQKVVTLPHVFEGHVTKCYVWFHEGGARHGTQRGRPWVDRVLCCMEIRTLNARHMFHEHVLLFLWRGHAPPGFRAIPWADKNPDPLIQSISHGRVIQKHTKISASPASKLQGRRPDHSLAPPNSSPRVRNL